MSITDSLPSLRLALKSILDENDRYTSSDAIQMSGDNIGMKPDDVKAYRANLEKAQEIKSQIDMLSTSQELRDALTQPETKSGQQMSAAMAAAAAGAGRHEPVPGLGGLGAAFLESKEYKAFRAAGGATMQNAWEIPNDIGGFGETKDVYSTSGGLLPQTGFGTVQRDPMVPREYRRARVRDLFPVSRTNASMIEFFRVLGFGTGRLDLTTGASMVPERNPANTEFALKPKSNLSFENANAPVRTIAHWEAAHRFVLDDEPQLQSTIDNELRYGLRLTEDNQILNGTGTGNDLLGLLRTPGIQSYNQSTVSTDNKQDAIRRAATLAFLAYYEPTGVVVNPFDWEDIELSKATDGHYMVQLNIAVGLDQRLWRMQVVDSPAIAERTALVGAFGIGAQLYDRMQANVRIAEQHEDFFVRNAIVILAEQRLALACKRPESFVRVNLSA